MDGLIFKAYIENQRKPKTQIAKELGMSKQNLYQLFDSKKLEDQTIKKIETVFKEKWTQIKASVNINGNIANTPVRPQEAQGSPDYRDDIISLLKEKLNLSERQHLLHLKINNALLKTALVTLAKIQAKQEKRKLEEVLVEQNNITELLLRDVKIDGT